MRKYEVLKIIFEFRSGASPKQISEKLKSSITNVYSYLKQLSEEQLVQKMDDGRYIANKTNENLQQILDLQAMAPDKFHMLITPSFKGILTKLCDRPKLGRDTFSRTEVNVIEKLAIPLRIVLKLSKRPAIYCLKINEVLVTCLLGYHDLKADFTLLEFKNLIKDIKIEESHGKTKTEISETEVIEKCDKAYLNNEDIEIINKAKNFKLDERLTDLLIDAEQSNKEYQLFLNGLDQKIKKAILDQWDSKYIYNTNSIEGNTMTEKEIKEFLGQGKSPDNISRRELHETTNMRHALDFLKLKSKENISEDFIKEIHFMIQKDIGPDAGQYKNFYNYVAPSPTTPPKFVKERMKLLMDWYDENDGTLHPFILASMFHMQFELIHPFGDANGRVGRLLLNFILQQKGYLPITILEKTKQNYYRALENRSIHQFLLHTLTSYLEEYKR